MTSFRNKFFPFILSLLALLAPAAAQEEEATDADLPAVEAPRFSIILNGRDMMVEGTGQNTARPFRPASGAPLSILPNPYLDPGLVEGQVVRLAQSAAQGESAETEAGEEDQDETGGLNGAALDPLDPASIGLMSETEAGFPPTLWQGSDPGVLPGLISALPAGTKSPTVNALMARLLLSPIHLTGDEAGGVAPEAFLLARLSKLYEAGDMTSLMELFEQITREERTPALNRLMSETYLLDGDFETACRLSGEGQRESGSAYFLELNAICLLLDGREGEARFTLSVLEESGETDFVFKTLFEDVAAMTRDQPVENPPAGLGAQTSLDSFFDREFFLLSDLTPLHIGILKVLDRQVEVSIDTQEASNLVLAALARWPALSLETKLEIADQALARGILRDHFLKELVGSYQFSAADKENAYLLDYDSWGVKSDALFYALAKESFDYPEAIHNIQEGWSRARIGDRAAYMAKLFYEAIADIPAEPGYVAFAPDAVRISLLAGQAENAFEWYQMVRERAAAGNPEATRMLVEMWPLMITLDEEGAIPYSPQILNLWRRSLQLLPPEEQLGRALLFYETLGILGFEVPPELKLESMLAISGEIGEGAFIGGASLGETILRVLDQLGAEDTVNASPFLLGDALYTFMEAGLSREGRLIVLEALIARGF